MHTVPYEKSLPLAQKVYDGLLQDIVQNRRGAGDRLVEAEIARELDVSRTPVREALNRLLNDGLIDSATSSTGYVVIRPSIEDIREIFEVRRALEPVGFAAVVTQAGPADDIVMRALRSGVREAETAPASMRANGRFRDFWLTRIPNQRMRKTLMRFHLQVQVVRVATLQTQKGRQAAADGANQLTEAFLSRDAANAHAAMTEFVDTALTYYEQADADGVLLPPPLSRSAGQ
ncbi:GntR family transcriptional regulator [Pseudooceanicola sp. HF7]|uniref:GntR family transcriptional regulator n=1 Tax=Pseudooceanicola sp. HF7 TaxID=2721560 RepID=UPI001430220A|nr:GntR family transcriptional regulator [Pseudooceanicola sp. HF7]NIZ09359.1 GntR family transcriptional regulator [Pseudooceanicola sp. HF7]